MKTWNRWREWLAARRWKKSSPEGDRTYTPLKPEPPGRTQTADATGNGTPQKWSPFGNRDRQLAVLQAGYDELIGLVRGIREHLEKQNQAQQELMKGLEKFNQTMIQVDRAQRESAADMRSLLERSEKRWAMVTAVLAVLLAAILGGAVYLAVLLRASMPPQERPPAAETRTDRPAAETTDIQPAPPARDTPVVPAGETPPPPMPPAPEEPEEAVADGDAEED